MSLSQSGTFTIRNLDHTDGHWTAIIRAADHLIPVDCRSGSWMTPPDEQGRCREVLPHVAAALQDRVRRLERKMARVAA